MNRRTTGLVGVLALLLVLLGLTVWWCQPAPPAVRPSVHRVQAPAPAPDPREAELEELLANGPPPTPTPPPEVRARTLAALATTTERAVVECPPPPAGVRSWGVPEGALCADGDGLSCAMEAPEGATVLRDDARKPVAVYHWRTDAAGVTTCAVEPPAETTLDVRVVDLGGQPIPGAAVIADGEQGGGETGRDGYVALTLASSAPVMVWAVSGDRASDQALGTPGAGLVIAMQPGAPVKDDNYDWFTQEVVDLRYAGQLTRVADLEQTLARTDLDPDERALLQQIETTERYTMDLVCAATIPPRQCAAQTQR